MANGIYKVTEDFEEALSKYTGAPYVIAVDNQSNGLFLSLMYEKVKGVGKTHEILLTEIETNPFQPRTEFNKVKGKTLKGAYQLSPTKVWDAALMFTADMYKPNTHMCVSFTGPYKHFKLSKGGAILTDDVDAYRWFKRARYSGRRELSYFEDNFDMLGWNFYMMPELAARGLLLMGQFYNRDGSKVVNKDLELPYPDLSKFDIYKNS